MECKDLKGDITCPQTVQTAFRFYKPLLFQRDDPYSAEEYLSQRGIGMNKLVSRV